jgi:predicted transcriptional regulator
MTQKEQIQRFDKLVEKLRQTLSSKGKDYASEDVLSNFKESAERIGQKPYEQCLSMISQKVSRLSNLFKQDRKPDNESVQDSILDLIGYSFLLDAITEEAKVRLKDKFAEAGVKRSRAFTKEEKELKKHFEEEGNIVIKQLEKEIETFFKTDSYEEFIKQAIFGEPITYNIRFKNNDKLRLEKKQAELMQRILLLSLVNQLTRSEKDKQELIKCFDELILISEKLGEDTTELKQERSKLS